MRVDTNFCYAHRLCIGFTLKRHARTKTSLAAALIAFGMTASLGSAAHADSVSVPLGTADGYAILAGTSITKTGLNTVYGDIGIFPGSVVSGAGAISHRGDVHAGDAAADIAKQDLVTGYNNAAAQTPPRPITADLAGQALTAGVYNSASSIALNGAVTLDGEGDPDSVFVFQAGSTLITGPGSVVNLVNGANACNVYWQVGSSATLDTDTTLVGTVMALTSITLNTRATVQGRVLARNGAVTLDDSSVLVPSCGAATPTPVTPPVVPDETTPDDESDEEDPSGGDSSTDDPTDNTSQITQKPKGPVDTGR